MVRSINKKIGRFKEYYIDISYKEKNVLPSKSGVSVREYSSMKLIIYIIIHVFDFY